MSTFVTILAATLVALPLVALVLRGTRADLHRRSGWRPTRDALGPALAAAPQDLDAVRATRDLDAVRAHQPGSAADAYAEVAPEGGPISAAGRCIHLVGSTSGTNPNLA